MHARTHAHTHTLTFNGPLSGTTRASRYQKGKTNLDFTEARDREWQWHQLGRMLQLSTQIVPRQFSAVGQNSARVILILTFLYNKNVQK